MDEQTLAILASILLQSAPLIIAVCGETLTERVGVINLSLDGSMLFSAMTGFVTAYLSGSVLLGFLAAAVVSALFALIVAFGSIELRQSQVAIGFVLTLLGADLSAFLGQEYTRLPGPSVARLPIPVLKDIPIIGPVFFNQDPVVYFALLLVAATWWWLFRSQPGLRLRAVGERPEAAFARGIPTKRLRYLYVLVGGALVGVAGAAYSLDVKIGWSDGHTLGLGWIALAIVIFGGWSPLRGAVGALLFGLTKTMATLLQRLYPEVSAVAFNALPWLLMIAVLLAVSGQFSEAIAARLPSRWQRPVRRLFSVAPPAALGKEFYER